MSIVDKNLGGIGVAVGRQHTVQARRAQASILCVLQREVKRKSTTGGNKKRQPVLLVGVDRQAKHKQSQIRR